MHLDLPGGTINNGQVYCAIDDSTVPMAALYAGIDFEDGECVTAYCPVMRDVSVVQVTTHTRRSGTPGQVQDGLPLSQLVFRGSARFRLQQQLLNIRDRAHLMPGVWVSRKDANVIKGGGIGWMANTRLDKRQHNVKLVPHRVSNLLTVQLLVATKRILAHKEILSPYNNHDKSII
jgi:hypothetical protein